jgi:hypothetical protein
MAKTVDRICEKYESKLRAGMMPGRVDGDHERHMAAFRRSVLRSEEIHKAMALVLSDRGVFTIWWPYYEDFTRVLAKQAARLGSPDVLCLAARAELENWVKRGLERSALEAIARDVFSLDLSGPIKPLDGSQTQT